MNNLKGNIPKSTIMSSGFINTDLDYKNNGGKLLFTHPNCVVVGLDEVPYMLFVTPEFDVINLPAIIKEKIYEVKKIVLKSTFSDEITKRKKYYGIPRWLIHFNNVESIDFEGVNLDNLDLLSECPIKHLIFHDLKFINEEKVALAIRQFSDLISISCSPSFFSHFKDVFQEQHIECLPLKLQRK